MSVFHQMGHDSQNLLGDPHLGGLIGAIVSPVNDSEEKTRLHFMKYGGSFVLDPQLYVPSSERGTLRTWSYFPSDFDTAVRDSLESWKTLNRGILESAGKVGAGFVCSPVVVPKVFDSAFFERMVFVGDQLAELSTKGIVPMQSALVLMSALADRGTALKIASILSATRCPWIYLVFQTGVDSRRELNDAEDLTGAMILISALEGSGVKVLVGFSGTELLLWKHAGASAVATGKYFNLRRFDPSRFGPPPASGGGQLPYWIEESLVAYVREGDFARLLNSKLLGEVSRASPLFQEVKEAITSAGKGKWLGKSWRQYLNWAANAEERFVSGRLDVAKLLETADANWKRIEEIPVFMEERANNGSWIRSWRQALSDFDRTKSGG